VLFDVILKSLVGGVLPGFGIPRLPIYFSEQVRVAIGHDLHFPLATLDDVLGGLSKRICQVFPDGAENRDLSSCHSRRR